MQQLSAPGVSIWESLQKGMKCVRRLHTAMIFAVLLPLWGTPSSLSAAQVEAEKYVLDLRDAVVAVLNDTLPRTPERGLRLRHLFTDAFDAPAVAETVLGRHWALLGNEERHRYVKVVPEYLATIYANQFANYRSQTFEIIGSREADGQDTAVETVVRGSGLERPMAIDVKVRRGGSGFRIRDVTVGGISLLTTKRDEFDSFLRRENAATLIAVIEEFTARE